MAKNAFSPHPNVRTGGTGSFQNFTGKPANKAPGQVVVTKGAVGPMRPKQAPQFSKTAGAKKHIGSLT
jgi:hypothetical protein